MASYTLHEQIKIDRWDEFKSIYSTIKALAETARSEYRKARTPLASILVVRHVKAAIAPLTRIYNYRYCNETLKMLLTTAVQVIQRMALELESLYETRFVEELRACADTLVQFFPAGDGVQLTLFDAREYHDEDASAPKLPNFKAWYYRILSATGFTNPIKYSYSADRQLTIPHLFHTHFKY